MDISAPTWVSSNSPSRCTGVRLAARSDHLRHRPSGLCAQDADRAAATTSIPLRKKDGLSGYPSRGESDHDWVESSHASSALSYADGLAKAFELTGHRNRHVVAVVGDGALTGGMCWEALNNIAAARRPVVIVVNDNGRSYAPTIGGFADHLAALRLQPGYEKLLEKGRIAVRGMPVIGELCYQCMHSVKAGLKDALAPQVMFTDLGLKYVGPIDGHDEHAVEGALRHARGFNAPVIVHVVTRKGMGYAPPRTTKPSRCTRPASSTRAPGWPPRFPGPGWTSAFSEALINYGAKRRDIVAITAAMPGPTGLSRIPAAVPRPVLRRRHRRAARDDVGGRPGDGRPAPGGGDLFDVPQPRVRPDRDGRRAAQASGDAGARPFRRHRAPTEPATTACGTCRCWASCPACGWPHRATPRGCTRSSARRSISTTGRPPCASPKVMWARTFRPSSGGRVDVLAVPGRRAVRRCAAGRGRTVRVDGAGGRRAAAQSGHRRDGGRPALGAAGAGRQSGNWRRPTSWWSPSRTTACAVVSAQRCRPRCAAPRSTCRAATSGCPRSSRRTRRAARCSPTSA